MIEILKNKTGKISNFIKNVKETTSGIADVYAKVKDKEALRKAIDIIKDINLPRFKKEQKFVILPITINNGKANLEFFDFNDNTTFSYNEVKDVLETRIKNLEKTNIGEK